MKQLKGSNGLSQQTAKRIKKKKKKQNSPKTLGG